MSNIEKKIKNSIETFINDLAHIFPQINAKELINETDWGTRGVAKQSFARGQRPQGGRAQRDPPIHICLAILKNGPNKGQKCTLVADHTGYCTRHRSTLSVTLSTILDSKSPKNVATKKRAAGAISKTEQEIIKMLSTAVPQEPTVLTPCKHGLLHEATDILFNADFQVIGMLNKDTIVPLGKAQLEICDQYGWCTFLDVHSSPSGRVVH